MLLSLSKRIRMDPGIMGLAVDDPALWGELGVFLNAKSEKKQRVKYKYELNT